MDTTDKYRDMCRAAKEIQDTELKDTTKDFMGSYVDGIYRRYVWLPRQDQLQEIWERHIHGDDYDNIGNKLFFMVDVFQCFALDDHGCGEDVKNCVQKMESMEQLWLLMVMRDVYEKKWVDGEWVE